MMMMMMMMEQNSLGFQPFFLFRVFVSLRFSLSLSLFESSASASEGRTTRNAGAGVNAA
jgi:hypothetical protein